MHSSVGPYLITHGGIGKFISRLDCFGIADAKLSHVDVIEKVLAGGLVGLERSFRLYR